MQQNQTTAHCISRRKEEKKITLTFMKSAYQLTILAEKKKNIQAMIQWIAFRSHHFIIKKIRHTHRGKISFTPGQISIRMAKKKFNIKITNNNNKNHISICCTYKHSDHATPHHKLDLSLFI